MKRDELEQWMKDALGKEEFIPNDAGWMKFHEAVNPVVKTERKKTGIFQFLKAMGIAASVIMLLAMGTFIYFKNAGKDQLNAVAASRTASSPASLLAKKNFPKIIPVYIPSRVNSIQRSPSNETKASKNKVTEGRNNDDTFHDKVNYTQYLHPKQAPGQDAVTTPATSTSQPGKQALPDTDLFGPLQENERKNASPLNLGVAAQFGKASVGNMNYQLGLVAHQRISEKFYAEATLAFASTEVSYVQKNNFQSVSIGASVGNNISNKSIDAKYRSNIFSAGISPAIGYRVTPGLALGCGMALYHNINQSVSLSNNEDIDPAAINNNLINPTNKVSSWDAGLTGNAAWNISSKLTVRFQYRYGLSTFMYFNNHTMRNSGLNLGVNYLFGK